MSEFAGLGPSSTKGVLTFLGQEVVVHNRQFIPSRISTHQELWESPAVRLFETALSGGETVIDFGAHIGVHTAVLQRLVGETGHVIAVEPHPDHAALLRETIERNDWANVELHEKAVTGHNGDATLVTLYQDTYEGYLENGIAKEDADSIGEWDVNSGASHIKETGYKEHGEIHFSTSVETSTFPELCRAASDEIELVKVDIEGGEPHVIETIANRNVDSINHLLIEVHPNETAVLEELLTNLRSVGKVGVVLPDDVTADELTPEIINSHPEATHVIVHWDISDV